jgi:hypothetical protein
MLIKNFRDIKALNKMPVLFIVRVICSFRFARLIIGKTPYVVCSQNAIKGLYLDFRVFKIRYDKTLARFCLSERLWPVEVMCLRYNIIKRVFLYFN